MKKALCSICMILPLMVWGQKNYMPIYTEKTKDVNFSMVFVEGGTFEMGNNEGEPEEKPVHSVTLSSYFIGQTEVTIGDYLVFCKATNSHYPEWLENGSHHNNPLCEGAYYKDMSVLNPQKPITGISWLDAVAYCTWLSNETKKNYRLPTEAEWEFAARGGPKSHNYTYSGSNNISDVAWYADNSNKETHPVKEKQANELGLYDMTGNVWEWCSDWYGDDFYSKSVAADPLGATSGSTRVFRGGSWDSFARGCRITNRNNYKPDYRYCYLGFRLALTL